jgi:aspartate-semialdehyde dehydrogenase
VVALEPLHDKATIKRVMVATYQSVSGAGKEAMDELFSQTKAVFTLGDVVNKTFPKRIAFNIIPEIDVFMEDGYTKEEGKMMMETKKILDPKIKLTATCVRVPVFVAIRKR